MKKINLFNADKSFTQNVADFTVKALWKDEYALRLRKEVAKDEASIIALENCKGSAIMTAEQVESAQKELREHIDALTIAYHEISNFWTKPEIAAEVKTAYKAYAAGKAAEGFCVMLKDWAGLDEATEDCDLVQILVRATSGDGAGKNTTQLVNTGKAALETRSKTEFQKIVYRRLFDYCVEKGTIRFVGNVVKGGGEDIAEILVETPSFVRAKCLKKVKKNA